MVVLATGLILCFGVAYMFLAWDAFNKESMPLIVIGLWLLGFLNILAGVGALLADYTLGVGPVAIGVVSIELGAIMGGYWQSETGPDWNRYAIRIAAEVFVVGLLVVSL